MNKTRLDEFLEAERISGRAHRYKSIDRETLELIWDAATRWERGDPVSQRQAAAIWAKDERKRAIQSCIDELIRYKDEN